MKKTSIKAFVYAICIMATPLFIASCSNDEEEMLPAFTDTPMTISAGVNQLTTRAGYESAADLQASPFGLYLETEGSTSGETNFARYNTENMKFEYSDGAWTGASQLLWKSSLNAVSYIAYMPYDEAISTEEGKTGTAAVPTDYAFSVQADQSDAANVVASDFLLCDTTGVLQPASSTAIDIKFKHMMSKLKIELSKGSELGQSTEFESVTVGNSKLSSVVNFAEGTVSPSDDAAAADVTPFATTASESYECILVPQTFTIAVTITSTDGKTYKYTAQEAETLESGYQYTLKLTVGRDKVLTGDFTASPWETNNEEGDGTLETE